jgi:endonuclease/exonuclease/phosphatase family metal-dependent hydrolase
MLPKNKIFKLLLCLLAASCQMNSQNKTNKPTENRMAATNKMVVMFYNVENLYDTEDDPMTSDEEFTPKGKLKWDEKKYKTKLEHIAQVIDSVGEDGFPDIIGFAEVENKKVLEDLIKKTNLKKTGYSIVHHESPDKRGIDVALFYNKKLFNAVKIENINAYDKNLGDYFTRDILYTDFIFNNDEHLHVFVNHWPSRRDGKNVTESKRLYAGEVLRKKVDEVMAANDKAKIIVMGDFNDSPKDLSIQQNLRAKNLPEDNQDLFNPFVKIDEEGNGSVYFEGEYNAFDQIMVSKSLLIESEKGLRYELNSAKTYRGAFVTFKDPKTGIQRPNRTYSGEKYHGGYSDHLAVSIELGY